MTMFKKTAARTPEEYIAGIKDTNRRAEVESIHRLIRKTVPKLDPHIRAGMIGYGSFHYKYASGREGDWCAVALASQKNYISVYICATSDGKYVAEKYARELGKVSVGKSCIRFKSVADVNLGVMQKALRDGAKWQASQKKAS